MAKRQTSDTNSTDRTSITRLPLEKKACCERVKYLAEYLSDEKLQLWAATESDEDLTLWVACRSCGKNSPLTSA